ncbi:MAG: flagellar motor protein [Bdellovibrionota bacterium]
MDMITIFGLLIGFVGIIGGMALEGGHIGSLMQFTAAIIVFGGTAGAVMVSTTKEDLLCGLRLLRLGFGEDDSEDPRKIMAEIVEAAQVARKESILALETRLARFSSPFMKTVFRYVIDGVDPHVIRDTFESKIEVEEENLLAGAKIYTDAGGYSPTIGIIGAVLGLIHVMSNLSDTSKLGSGIAVAFVATIYGVAAANLLFLPLGSKIKRKIKKRMETQHMILEGAIGVLSGLNPFVIEERLRAFVQDDGRGGGKAA